MDVQGLGEITEALESFAEGNPQHFEIDVAEGVWFEFDCPHKEDLLEPIIPVSVSMYDWSPYYEGKPNSNSLMRYNMFGDTLAADLEAAFYNAGSVNEEVPFEYSENNSGNGIITFMGAIDNPFIGAGLSEKMC